MLGAIMGDIVGSRFEARGRSHKSKQFNLFTPYNHFTDDTVLTVAVAEALLSGKAFAEVYRGYFRRYPNAGYGGRYIRWASDASAEPYDSWGNGSAMRVSPVGWWAKSLDEALAMAKETAMPTHGHREAVIGAQAAAGSIFLARTGADKAEIKQFVEQISQYDLDRSCDEIRPDYQFDVSCKGTVPPAIIAFLESTSFEDAIRNAVSLGGDSDTLTCITGGIAEAYYGIPDELRQKTLGLLDDPLPEVVAAFEARYIRPSVTAVSAQPSRLSRITGCLLAGAVGDALGAVVEFSSMADIRRKYGKCGIQEYAPCYSQLGSFTDDTQMTLFTAEGLLQARQSSNKADATEYRVCVLEAYIRWLGTQGTVSKRPELAHIYQGTMWNTPELHARRAPGGTCLGGLSRYLCNLESGHASMDLHPLNNSKGCGGVMRMAPVGFVSGVDHFALGCELAKLSHGHVSGYLPSGYLALLIHHLVEGVGLKQAIELSTERLKEEPGHDETLACVMLACELAASPEASAEASSESIERIGAGWVAEEALAISLFCAIRAQGFEHGIRLAVNHSGDSDSTGAITGNILGALHGREYIPDRWIDPLELRELVETVGQQSASAWT